MSGSTVRKIHYIISGALEQAVRWRHLGVNPAALAIAPTANQTEPDPPSAAEAAALLGSAWNDPDWGTLLWVIMITGMRRGEISAPRWRHIDFAAATLVVQQANAQPKTGVKEKQTKSRQQRRVAIDPQTAGLLLEHRERWEQRCEQIGISFREDVRTVAGRLGHGSGGATTLKVYAAWMDEADRRAATTMAGIMPPPVAAPRPPRGPYEVIAAALREQIVAGQLRPGDQLPTVVEIATTHCVSVGTAHRAIDLLRQDGLIAVSRGRRATVVR